jgi:hypothetical protein
MIGHEWSPGVVLPGAPPLALATCARCEALRVRELQDEGRTKFLRRRADDARVLVVEPECLPAVRFSPPW